MKLDDILMYNNCMFVYDQLNDNLPYNFKEYFITASN